MAEDYTAKLSVSQAENRVAHFIFCNWFWLGMLVAAVFAALRYVLECFEDSRPPV